MLGRERRVHRRCAGAVGSERVEGKGGTEWGMREEENGMSGLVLGFCYIVECSSWLWVVPDFFS